VALETLGVGGAAAAPLNWTGRPLADLRLELHDLPSGTVRSLEHGPLTADRGRDRVSVSRPLHDIDVLLCTP